MLGQNSTKTVESMMSAQKYGPSLIATIVGRVALLIGAGGVFGQLQVVESIGITVRVCEGWCR
jgi:hypothetical protein